MYKVNPTVTTKKNPQKYSLKSIKLKGYIRKYLLDAKESNKEKQEKI